MYAHNTQIADLKASADIILEYDDNQTYLGFCLPGTHTTAQNTWSVLQINETNPGNHGNIITFKWAGGQCNYVYAFDDFYSLPYSFKKF